MRVLMFGWEFPPHISGGLGTACHGLTHSLEKEEVEVLFVVPKLHGDEPAEHLKLINASDIRIKSNPRIKNFIARQYLMPSSNAIDSALPQTHSKSSVGEPTNSTQKSNIVEKTITVRKEKGITRIEVQSG